MIIKKRTADETLPTIGIHGVTSLGTMKASSLVLRNIAPIQTATHIGGIHLNTRRGIFAKLTEPCFQMPPLSINTPLLILVNYATFQFRHSIGELQSNIIVSNNTTFQKTFIKAIGVFHPHTIFLPAITHSHLHHRSIAHLYATLHLSIAQETIQCNISYKQCMQISVYIAVFSIIFPCNRNITWDYKISYITSFSYIHSQIVNLRSQAEHDARSPVGASHVSPFPVPPSFT